MVARILSGGQTGVDRAALDAALTMGVPCGGRCPRGRRAEDGPIPARYPLRETAGAGYPERTALNVADADATLIISRGPLTGGTALTAEIAQRYGKPCLVSRLDQALDPREVLQWLEGRGIQVLNVAGPRESQCPGIYAEARDLVERLIVLARASTGAADADQAQSPQPQVSGRDA